MGGFQSAVHNDFDVGTEILERHVTRLGDVQLDRSWRSLCRCGVDQDRTLLFHSKVNFSGKKGGRISLETYVCAIATQKVGGRVEVMPVQGASSGTVGKYRDSNMTLCIILEGVNE